MAMRPYTVGMPMYADFCISDCVNNQQKGRSCDRPS